MTEERLKELRFDGVYGENEHAVKEHRVKQAIELERCRVELLEAYDSFTEIVRDRLKNAINIRGNAELIASRIFWDEVLEKRYLNLEKARTAYNDAYEINEGLIPIYNISTKTLKAVRELDPCLDLKTTETSGTLEQINLFTILTRLNTKFIHQREQFMDTMLVMGLDTKHSFDMVSYLKTAFFEDDKIDLSVVVDLSTLIDDDKEFIVEIYDMLHDIREEYTAAWGHVKELQAEEAEQYLKMLEEQGEEAEKAYVLDGVENTMTRLWGDRPAPSEFT